MQNRDKVEFYDIDGNLGRDLVAAVNSSIVPDIGSRVNIRNNNWEVVSVSYCVDYCDDIALARVRANVELKKPNNLQ